MDRARRFDMTMVLVLTPLWLFCVLLHGRLVWQDQLAWLPVYVEPAGEALRVSGLWPDTEPGVVGVQPGDQLLQVGGQATRGWGRWRFVRESYDAANEEGRVAVQLIRGEEQIDGELALRPVAYPWRTIPLVVGLGAMGLLLPLRGRGARAARNWAAAGLALSLHYSYLFAYPGWQAGLGLPLFLGGAALFYPFLLRAGLFTPEIPGHQHGAAQWLPWVFLLNGPATSSWLIGAPWDGVTGLRIIFVINFAAPLLLGGIMLRNYLRSDAVGRRKLKWVVFGVLVSGAPIMAAAALAAAEPALWGVYEVSLVALVFAPVCIFIAFVRDNFLDINRLLSTTAIYGILSVLGLAVVLSVIPLLSERISGGLGLGTGTVQTLLSVVFAAVIVPAGRVIRSPVERVMFRERHTLEEGLRELRRDLGSAGSALQLLESLGERLGRYLRLDTCVIYSLKGDALEPLFTQGRGVPGGFATAGRLAALLEESHGPVSEARWKRWARKGLIDELEAASLEALGPMVLLPVLRDEDLAAIICLGEKQSADVYTAGDLSILEGIADRAGLALQRFDQRDVEAEHAEMQRALRRYVPDAVATQLARGGEIAPGSREVSILFVDLRGYTTFSESRTPDQIFETINAYTKAVSETVKRHGGSIVDFQGDGLFAVFGAPEPLPDKERCAVAAARETLEVVAALEVPGGPATPESAVLRAGIGVATGEAYVGNIESSDRQIWGVIGNTTNLAARLQGLTRDLAADIVVDTTTADRTADLTSDFEHRTNVRVKGRSEPFELHCLPIRH